MSDQQQDEQQDERPDEALKDLEVDRTQADQITGGKIKPGNIPFEHYFDKSSP